MGKLNSFCVMVMTSLCYTQAHAMSCPQIAGSYGLAKAAQVDIQTMKNAAGVSGWYFAGDTDVLRIQNGSPEPSIAISQKSNGAADVLNLGRSYVSFTLDGMEHIWDEAPSADHYFRKYTATCSANTITIVEDGSNNDTNEKRVDTYHVQTVITNFPDGSISIQRDGQMLDANGVLAVQGKESLHYK